MKTDQLRRILSRQNYRPLPGAADYPCELWQSPTGRIVCLDTADAMILTKADIEAKARANCGPDTRDYYLAVIFNWE